MNKKRLLVCLGALLVLGVLAALAVPYGKKIMQERQEAKKAAAVKQILTEFHPFLKSLQSAAIKLAETRGTDDERRFTFSALKEPMGFALLLGNGGYLLFLSDEEGKTFTEKAYMEMDNSYIVLTPWNKNNFFDNKISPAQVYYFFRKPRELSFSSGEVVCAGNSKTCPDGMKTVGTLSDYLEDEIKNSPEIPCIAMGYQQAICLVGDRTSKS